MANLIIKSSADNLVLQGSDASPAITVGAAGTTTFAENASFTTGNIGTLTSATTFPVGHVVNTWSYNQVYSGNMSITIADAWHNVDYGGSHGNMNLTGITATTGNKLFISCNPGNIRTNTDGTHETVVGLKIDTTDFVCIAVWYNQTYLIANGNFNMVYTVPASFTNKTIGLWAGRQTGNNGDAYLAANNNVISGNPISLIIQEIQQ